MTLFALLAISPSQCNQAQIDSYCELYTQVLCQPGDEQIKAPLAVRKRLLVNEKLFRKVCPQQGNCPKAKV